MTTIPTCRPETLGRDWLGRVLAGSALALGAGLFALDGAERPLPTPTAPVMLEDPAALAPASSDPATGRLDRPAIEEPATDWRDIPLFASGDPDAPPIDKTADRVLQVSEAGDLTTLFDELGYDYATVGDLGITVPRIYLAELPGDLDASAHAGERPALFINALLPLLLRVNEAVEADRAQVLALEARLTAGAVLSVQEQAILGRLAQAYDVDLDGAELAVVQALKARVDTVPPSMALAQAAVESGWGTSSLAQNANALFGQIGSSGIQAASGHTYATFDTLLEAVEAYVHNLNTHPAYDEFRALRSAKRADGRPLDGTILMTGLDAYSELGGEYIGYVQGLIRSYELHRLDGARLADPGDPADRTPAAI
jgi:Bax protein